MDMVYIKGAIMLIMWILVGGTAQYVFTTTFKGVSFLNSSTGPS